MIPFQERKKFRQIIYSKASIAVLLVFSVLIAHGAWKVHEKAIIAKAESGEAERTLSEMENRSKELEASLVRLKTDRGIEEEVRQKFAVARPGEEVVVIVDENSKKSKNGEALEEKSFWDSIKSFFGKE
ncbi:MAG: hypothetical protein AAB628_01200 [Patescibacteria group bacterium]